MAELTQQERLQPSLLDRLIDDAPGEQQESREARVLSLRRLREAVLRDLSWLLNSSNFESVADLAPYPEVAQSVVNFGMPALAGGNASSLDVADIERQLKQVIASFEPRILRETLKVRLAINTEKMSQNTAVFEIEGQLWAQPVPQRLYLRTEVDLELGQVKISDYLGSSAG